MEIHFPQDMWKTMKSAAAQPDEVASLMKSACGLMKSGFALIVEFCNLPIAK